MKHRGRPIRGAVAGFFFGLFLSLDLLIFGVVATDADILAVFPILGLAAGLALGLVAPLKRRSPAAAVEAIPSSAPESVPDSAAAPAAAEPNPTTV